MLGFAAQELFQLIQWQVRRQGLKLNVAKHCLERDVHAELLMPMKRTSPWPRTGPLLRVLETERINDQSQGPALYVKLIAGLINEIAFSTLDEDLIRVYM